MSVFSHINIKKETVKKFRVFAPKIAPTYSEALDKMMDFFQRHGLSPDENIGPQMGGVEKRIKKRIDAVIAIIKDIEKNQTKPTVALLQAFLEEKLENQKPIEVKWKYNEEQAIKKEGDSISKVVHEKLEREYLELKTAYFNTLEKVTEVESRFGKDYLKMDISLSELNRIKRDLKKD